MTDETFLRAWTKTLEQFGNKATVKDFWSVSDALEQELKQETEQ